MSKEIRQAIKTATGYSFDMDQKRARYESVIATAKSEQDAATESLYLGKLKDLKSACSLEDTVKNLLAVLKELTNKNYTASKDKVEAPAAIASTPVKEKKAKVPKAKVIQADTTLQEKILQAMKAGAKTKAEMKNLDKNPNKISDNLSLLLSAGKVSIVPGVHFSKTAPGPAPDHKIKGRSSDIFSLI